MLSVFLVLLTLKAFGHHMRRLAILQLHMKRLLGAAAQRGVVHRAPDRPVSSYSSVFSPGTRHVGGEAVTVISICLWPWKEPKQELSRWFQSISCSVAKSCLSLCDPMDCNTPDLPVPHYLPEFVHVHWIADDDVYWIQWIPDPLIT